MNLPFTVEQFFSVFERYNSAIWPAQIVAYVLGVIAVVIAIRGGRRQSLIMLSLAAFWVWMGAVYHIMHFSAVNPAARLFGVLFIVQGVLFAILHGRLSFQFRLRPAALAGGLMILYSMAIYPALGAMFGHSYPGSPVFGVAPCPATIFTFGILLLAVSRVPVYVLIIPLLWSLIGTSAAVHLEVPQDYGLGVAGILGSVLIVVNNRKHRSKECK